MKNIAKIFSQLSASSKQLEKPSPCKSIGFELTDNTILVAYRVLRNRDCFKEKLEDIMADAKLLAKFHSTDTVMLGYLSAIQVIKNDFPESMAADDIISILQAKIEIDKHPII